MKQFNLEKYLKNPSRKVVTRNGRDARIICTDKKGFLCIVALVSNGNGGEDTFVYYSNGTSQAGVNSSIDLFFASIKHEGWVNIFSFPAPEVRTDGSVYDSYEEAKSFVKNNPDAEYYVATVKIEWEE